MNQLVKRALDACVDGRVEVGPRTFCMLCIERDHKTKQELIGALEDGNIALDEDENFQAHFKDGGKELV